MPVVDGLPCDDSNNRTTGDSCQSGICVGVDLCQAENITCRARSQCHTAGDCFQGMCSHPHLPPGTACSDGNPLTLDDICREGACNGEDPCDAVTCTALDQCHAVGDCSFGVCSDPPKVDGATCDDNSLRSYYDVCTNGLCAGLLPCAEGSECVAWRRKDGVVETDQYGLRRTRSGGAWNAGAFSERVFTPCKWCSEFGRSRRR